jgi:hypothetical protein
VERCPHRLVSRRERPPPEAIELARVLGIHPPSRGALLTVSPLCRTIVSVTKKPLGGFFMNVMHWGTAAATMAALLGVSGTAQAAFQGRDATGAASGSCTATGANRCTYFYDTTLDITILNNWFLGTGFWSETAAPGSAQAVVAGAGLAASGLTGWMLPTGDGDAAAGAQNQYRSIYDSVGNSYEGLLNQFHLPQPGSYWSNTRYLTSSCCAWFFRGGNGAQSNDAQTLSLVVVAVRPGDIAAIPEPQTYAMMLLGIGALILVVRRRPR